MRIPQIQERLRGYAMNADMMADQVGFALDPPAWLAEHKNKLRGLAKSLREAADELSRRSAGPGPQIVTSAAITPEVRSAIREFHRTNPNLSQHEIAQHFNVNAGRVSEALKGFRR